MEILWNYLEDLDFDADKCLGQDNIYARHSAYVRWVNRVIKAHRAPLVKKFRIFFYLDSIHARNIDSWVRFCSRKGVQELELDCGGGVGNPDDYYSVESMRQLYQPLNTRKIPTFINLRSFRMDSLKVSGSLLELMLSKCPLLEILCLKTCRDLGSLKVVGSSLKLKYLELMNCDADKVIIDAPNLGNFVYWGSHVDLVYTNAPSLVEAKFVGRRVKGMIAQLSCISFQLETHSISSHMDNFRPITFPSFFNLKRLALHLYARQHQSILVWSHLIDACPRLLELKLELDWWTVFSSEFKWETKGTKKIHLCLEDVHLVGVRFLFGENSSFA